MSRMPPLTELYIGEDLVAHGITDGDDPVMLELVEHRICVTIMPVLNSERSYAAFRDCKVVGVPNGVYAAIFRQGAVAYVHYRLTGEFLDDVISDVTNAT